MKKSFKRRIISTSLVFSVLLSSLPVISLPVSAEGEDARPLKENSEYYNPNIKTDYENSLKDMATSVKDATKDVHDIGRLPTIDEFAAQTGYTKGVSSKMSLTNFREVYGVGGAFSAPTGNEVERIWIADPYELEKFSDLVNGVEDGETAAEQAFYSTAKYELFCDIDCTAIQQHKPIGTAEHPFNGDFDGTGLSVKGISIVEDDRDSLGLHYAGLFGYVGSSGKINRLGVSAVNIKLYLTPGADVGVISGRNYGTITNCFVANSYVEASNATVGGISAENYGTISNTYADFKAKVDNTEGSYSDPQPIAPVNSGTITNSYFLHIEHMDSASEKREGNRLATYEDWTGGWDMSFTDYYEPYYKIAKTAKDLLSLDYIKEHHGIICDDDKFTSIRFLSMRNSRYIGWDSAKLVTKEELPYGYSLGYHNKPNDLSDYNYLSENDYIQEPPVLSDEIFSRQATISDLSDFNTSNYLNGNIYLYKYHLAQVDSNGNPTEPISDTIQSADDPSVSIPIVYDLDSDGCYIPVYNSDGSMRTKTVYYHKARYKGYVHDDYTGYNGTAVWAEDLATTVNLGGWFDSGEYSYDMSESFLDFYSVSDLWNAIYPQNNDKNGYHETYEKDYMDNHSSTVIVSPSAHYDWPYESKDAYDLLRGEYDTWYDAHNSEFDYYYRYHTERYSYIDSLLGAISRKYNDLTGSVPPLHTKVYKRVHDEVFSEFFNYLNSHPIDSSLIIDNDEESEYSVVEAWLVDFNAFAADLKATRDSIYEEDGYVPGRQPWSDPNVDPEVVNEIKNRNAKELYEYYKDRGGINIKFTPSSAGYGFVSDWNDLASVLSSDDCPEYVRKLISTANIHLLGFTYTDWHASYTINSTNIGLLSMRRASSDLIPLGTAEHPFNGTFDGHNVAITFDSNFDVQDRPDSQHNFFDNTNDVSSFETQNPLFGVIGENGCVKNLKFYIVGYDSGWYPNNVTGQYRNVFTSDTRYSRLPHAGLIRSNTTQSLLCRENRGTISNISVVGELVLNTFDVVGNKIVGSVNDDVVAADYYAIAQNNKGTISNCGVDVKYSKFKIEQDENNENSYIITSEPIGVANAVKQNSGSVSGIHINTNTASDAFPFNNLGTADADAANFYTEIYHNIEDGQFDVPYANESLISLPSLITDTQLGSDGKYHITDAKGLCYFMASGTGESVVLDNTIDMDGFPSFTSGYFNLDGTLTDENDICAHIDLGTGTKCYGILNLNGGFSSSCNMSNVYFIGGCAKADSSFSKIYKDEHRNYYRYSNYGYDYEHPIHFVYGTNLNNVHSSADIRVDRESAMCYSATKSSYSGRFILSGSIQDDALFACVGYQAYDCTSWGTLDADSNFNGNAYVCGVALDAKRCTSHFSVSDTAAIAQQKDVCVYGIGEQCFNCVLENDCNFSGQTGVYNVDYFLFGHYVSDCLIRADINIPVSTFANKEIYVNKQFDNDLTNRNFNVLVQNFVVDNDAVISGNYGGVNCGHCVWFEGTVNTANDIENRKQAKAHIIGKYVKSAYNKGTWNVHVDDIAFSSVYGMGEYVDGCMAASVNFIKNADSQTPILSNFNLYGYGWGSSEHSDLNNNNSHAYNCSDFTPSFTLSSLKSCHVFVQSNYTGPYQFNYGAVNIDSINVKSFYVCAEHGCNFANIDLTVGRLNDFYVCDMPLSFTNYGKVIVTIDTDRTEDYSYSSGSFGITDDGYSPCNAGDFDINLINYSRYSDHNSSAGSLYIYGCKNSGKNYGNISVKGIPTNNVPFSGAGNIYVRAAGDANYGKLSVSDLKLVNNSNIDITDVFVGGNSGINLSNDNSIVDYGYLDKGSISVENCYVKGSLTAHGVYFDSRHTSSNHNSNSYGQYKNLSVKTNNSITVKNVKTESLCVVGGADFKYRDTTKSANISTNIVIDNISEVDSASLSGKSINIFGAIRRGSANGNDNGSITVSASGDISVNNINHGCPVAIAPFGNTYKSTVHSGINLEMKNCSIRNNITIADNTFYYYNKIDELNGSGDFISSGSIDFENNTANNIYITGGVSNIVTLENRLLCLNTGDIFVKDSNAVDDFIVSGAALSIKGTAENRAEVHNLGAITYENASVTDKNVSISGVANEITADGVITNGGHIAVDIADGNPSNATHDTTFRVSGVCVKSSDHAVNLINAGTIDFNSEKSDNLDIYVSGIIQTGDLVSSVINYGDLNVTANYDTTASRVHVSPMFINAENTSSWLNYGNVSFDSNILSDAQHFVYAIGSGANGGSSDYGINYGTFTYANVDKSLCKSAQWAVDFGADRNVLPRVEAVYSTDTSRDVDYSTFNRWCKHLNRDDVQLRSGSSLVNTVAMTLGIPYYANFQYGSIFDPGFAFLHDNPIAVKYVKANIKEEYYLDNLLIKSDYKDISGMTERFFAGSLFFYPDANRYGVFILAGNVYSDSVKGVYGKAGYCMTDWLIDREVSIPVSFDNKYYTCNTFGEYLQALRQRTPDKGSDAKILHDISLKSTSAYPTKTGGHSIITSKSSLIPFQAPIDGIDFDFNYNYRSYITVADVYIPTNGFSSESFDDCMMEFELNISDTSYGSEFKTLQNPIRFKSYDNCVEYLRQSLKDEDTYFSKNRVFTKHKADDPSSTHKLAFKLEKDSDVCYIAGVNFANDKSKENVLVLRLHSVEIEPAAYPTTFSYPTGLSSNGKSFEYTDVWAEDTMTSDSDFYASTDLYKVVDKTVTNSEYENKHYPVYVLNNNMEHTTDGAYSRSISNTGNVNIKFNTLNVNKYVVYVSKQDLDFNNAYSFNNSNPDDIIYYKGTMDNDSSTATPDGVYTSFSSDLITLSNDVMKSLANNFLDEPRRGYTLTNNNSSSAASKFNMFLERGYRYITVGTILNSDEFMPLFQVKLYKSASDEDYMLNGGFSRKDYLTDDKSSERESNLDVIRPGYWEKSIYNRDNMSVSTLASYHIYDVVQDNLCKSDDGKTRYMDTITYGVYVTSEDRSSTVYKHVYHLVDIDQAGLNTLRSGSGYASGTNASTTTESRLFIMDDSVSNLNLTASYDNVRFLSDDRTYHAKLATVNVYINGEKAGSVYRNSDTDDLHWNYVVGNQVSHLRFSIDTNNNFFIKSNELYRDDFANKVVTIEPVVEMSSLYNYTVKLEPISFATRLLDESRLVAGKWNKCLFISNISTNYDNVGNDMIETNDVDINENGVIDYSQTADSVRHFYISNCVNDNVTKDTLTLTIPRYSTLEKYNESTGKWVSVAKDTSGVNKTVYQELTYDTAVLASTGYKYRYRIKSQAYSSSDADPESHITYYDFMISTTTRNKIVDINFATDDTATMDAYHEIIANDGNTAIQLKNMNARSIKLQQTKLYVGDTNMESAFYKLTQGDFAIDVKVPEGYVYKVKIVGGSSEGFLYDSNYTVGKRLRLPYRNQQHISLKVYLEKETSTSEWGVIQNRSLFKTLRQNMV